MTRSTDPSTMATTAAEQTRPTIKSEQTTTDASPSADSATGEKPHGHGMAVIAGVSATVVVLGLLAAVIIICTVVVVYVVKIKRAPQSRGFTRLSVISSTDSKNATAI